MRAKLATSIVVGGVATIAPAALVSAVVAGRPANEGRDARLDPLAAELEALGVRGTLVYRDPRCRLHALRLPTLEPVTPPAAPRGCKASASSSGDGTLPDAVRRALPNEIELRESPRRTFVAAIDRSQRHVEVFDARGMRVDVARTLIIRTSIAWSPDEEWTALATRASVYLFRTRDPYDRLIRLPVATRDVAWL